MSPLDFLKNGEYELEFHWLGKHIMGLWNDGGVITLNLASMIVDIYVHEWMHARFPKEGESRIEARTYRFVERMSRKDVEKLCRAILRRFYESGPQCLRI